MKNKQIVYPIEPRHLDTSEIPKGFDPMLDHGEMVILWTLVQYCQHKKSWAGFTWDEFMKFVDDKSVKINDSIRSGVLYFTGPGVNYLFTKHINGDNICTFNPTHYMISIYFFVESCKDK